MYNDSKFSMTFNDLNISKPILKAIEEKGYITPTPIQEQAIPVATGGRDILGLAQTGTGKTAAFAIPIIEQLKDNVGGNGGRPIKALILTPTRELAIQIEESFTDYGKYTGVRHTVIFGGVNQNPQVRALKSGTDVLIATPGRLLDLIGQGFIRLDKLQIFVLDEADRMLDMGFIHDIKRILPLLPKRKQTMLFSATMPSEVEKISSSLLFNPKKVAVTPVSSVVDTIEQHSEKRNERVLIFSRTKHGADKIARLLKKQNLVCEAIHGNKSQNARQNALNNFKSGKSNIIVATDIAARGIDIQDLGMVINFDLPDVPETYVHRIGRTGRAGAKGVALSFCSQEEKDMVRDIKKLTGVTLINGFQSFVVSNKSA
jgi:ATP-dependent RNA helicase RhlE